MARVWVTVQLRETVAVHIQQIYNDMKTFGAFLLRVRFTISPKCHKQNIGRWCSGSTASLIYSVLKNRLTATFISPARCRRLFDSITPCCVG
jgi:hypothetical protein